MDINLLVNITSKAWALTILSLMDQGTPGRQAQLLARSGAGRTAFGQSLSHLQSLGLVERTPGHGHPLRPEFRLTPAGQAAGAAATRILAPVAQDARPIVRRSWTLPVLATLTRPRRFSDIGHRLGPITDRALSQSLDMLQAQTWVTRKVDVEARPPRSYYCAINNGQQIAQAATAP